MVRRVEREFTTDWSALVAARSWVVEVLLKAGATLLAENQFRYTLESTGCYHLPVCHAFEGKPSIVNPLLASPSRRKTDVLDARLLAYHSITGLWPESFLCPHEVQALRVASAMRRSSQRSMTQASNKINNVVLRYGHTFGSMTKVTDSCGRPIVEALIEGKLPDMPGVSNIALPSSVRIVVADLLQQFDNAAASLKKYQKLCLEIIQNLELEH